MLPLTIRDTMGRQDDQIGRAFLNMMIDGAVPDSVKTFTIGGQAYTTLCMTHKGMIGYREETTLVSVGMRFFGSRVQYHQPSLSSMSWRRGQGGYTALVHRSEVSVMVLQALNAIRCCGEAWVNPEAPGTWTVVVANGTKPMQMQPMSAPQGLLLRELLTNGDQMQGLADSMSKQRERQVALEQAKARLMQTKQQLERVGASTPSVLTERTYLDTVAELQVVNQQLETLAADFDAAAEEAAALFAGIIGNSIALSALQYAERAMALTGRRLNITITSDEQGAGE